MTDRNVILVEDILDTGLTLNYIQKLLLAHQPKTLRIAALLDKPSRRKKPIHAHYIGFADSGRLRGGLRTGLRGTLSQSAGYLRDRESLDSCAETCRSTRLFIIP